MLHNMWKTYFFNVLKYILYINSKAVTNCTNCIYLSYVTEYGEIGTLIYRWRKCKMLKPLWETDW